MECCSFVLLLSLRNLKESQKITIRREPSSLISLSPQCKISSAAWLEIFTQLLLAYFHCLMRQAVPYPRVLVVQRSVLILFISVPESVFPRPAAFSITRELVRNTNSQASMQIESGILRMEASSVLPSLPGDSDAG